MSSATVSGPVVLPPDNIQPGLQNGLHSANLPPTSLPPTNGIPNDLSAEPPRVGMSYEDMAAAKKHITEWCVRERIPYSVWKADRRCWVLTCKDKNNCLFRLRVKNTDRPVISILEAHTCSSLSFRRTAQTGGPIKATPYNWPHDASLSPQTTALVLVDMQRDCTFTISQAMNERLTNVLCSLCSWGFSGATRRGYLWDSQANSKPTTAASCLPWRWIPRLPHKRGFGTLRNHNMTVY